MRISLVLAALVALFAFFAVVLHDDGFTTGTNLLNILRQTAPITVMAVAFVFVLSAGQIDLSVGAVVALSALVTARLLEHAGLAGAVAAGLGVGVAAGALNGLLVTLLRLPAFLVTLASLAIFSGLARTISELRAIAIADEGFVAVFGSGDAGPVPGLALWALGAVVVGHFGFRHTRFGAHVVATGDNAAAARVAGIRVARVRFAVLTLSGAAAGLAGILYAGRLHGATYTLGESDLLVVIGAAVIGGTRLFGGEGNVVGALLGSLLLGTLTNGLILWGLTASEQMIAQGVLLLLVIALTQRERVA